MPLGAHPRIQQKNATIKYGQFKQEEQQVIQEEQEQKSGIDA